MAHKTNKQTNEQMDRRTQNSNTS